MLNASPPPSSSASIHSAPAILPKLLGGVAVLLFGIGVFNFHLPNWGIELSDKWGPAFFLTMLLAAAAVRWIPKTAIQDFVTAQQGQAFALHAIALSVKEINERQSDKLDDIKAQLDSALINQRVMLRQMEHLTGTRASYQEPQHVPIP